MANAKTTAKAVATAKPAAPKAPETTTSADETVVEKPSTKGGKKDGRFFTYIGGGDSSPYVITLMGKQKFVRGELTEVTDPDILAKIGGMSTFVEGEADAATLHKIDQEGKEAYEAQIAQDRATNARYNKKHRGE